MKGHRGNILRTVVGGAVCTFLFVTPAASAAEPDTPAADGVLGQPAFDVEFGCSQYQRPSAVTARSLCAPQSVAVARSLRLYVADTENSRILSWPDAERFSAGEVADLVLGQPDFQSVGCGVPSASSLCLPFGVAVDGRDRLYVADSSNNRVLRFDTPSRTGQPADLVLGQATFGSVGQGCLPGAVGPASLCLPYAVSARNGVVYVADTGNHRLLHYARPRLNGQAADLVLGQADFRSNACNAGPAQPASDQTLCVPSGVAVAPGGEVFVSDAGNNRVLRYQRPSTTDQRADLVLGQPDFTSSLRHCVPDRASAQTLCEPFGVAVSGSGEVYVVDRLNSRVLRYDRPQSNDPHVAGVIGQENVQDSSCNDDGVSERSLCGPAGLTLHGGRLYVADAGNSRVLRYPRAPFFDTGADATDSSDAID